MYETLKSIHLLSMGVWFGSGIAIVVIGLRALRAGGDEFGSFALNAGWWAGRAHPAAGVLLLLTGGAMTAERWTFGEPWIIIALVGLIVAMGIGGAIIGASSTKLSQGVQAAGGTMTAELRPVADRLLLWSRIEIAIVGLVIVDMVVKPGL